MTRHDSRSTSHGRLTELSRPECLELLATSSLGRAVWCSDGHPALVLVNYVVHDGAVWLRSTPYSSLARRSEQAEMLFEVDDHDDATHAGWSVVVRGRAGWRLPGDVPRDLPPLEPWPAQSHPVVVSIAMTELSGRRLRAS